MSSHAFTKKVTAHSVFFLFWNHVLSFFDSALTIIRASRLFYRYTPSLAAVAAACAALCAGDGVGVAVAPGGGACEAAAAAAAAAGAVVDAVPDAVAPPPVPPPPPAASAIMALACRSGHFFSWPNLL